MNGIRHTFRYAILSSKNFLFRFYLLLLCLCENLSDPVKHPCVSAHEGQRMAPEPLGLIGIIEF